MELNKKTILAHTNDPDKLLRYIDTGLSYLNVCKLQLSINKMKLEMGQMSKHEFRNQTRKILKKVMTEIMDIRDYSSVAVLQNRFKELSQGAKSEIINTEEITPAFIENRLTELFEGIKEIIDVREYKDFLCLPNKNNESIQ